MIIGMGTGRCGTVSASTWFDTWHEFKTMRNQHLSEAPIKENWIDRLHQYSNQYEKTLGDVSLDHINNLDFWFNYPEEVTMFCLYREQDDFVKSLKNRGMHRSWLRLFPQFDMMSEDGMRKYHDWYYDTVFKYSDKIAIIHMAQVPRHENRGNYVRSD